MIETERLLLRDWKDDDLQAFANVNADPEVAEYLPSTLSREHSDLFALRIRDHIAQHGYGLWAVEIRATAAFVGYVGIAHIQFESHFTPNVEIGWRLAREAWGRGYAREGAEAVLRDCFEVREMANLVSFTVPANTRSWTLMERLGMTRDEAEDFEHPSLSPGHPLRRHVLYRLTAHAWRIAHAEETGL